MSVKTIKEFKEISRQHESIMTTINDYVSFAQDVNLTVEGDYEEFSDNILKLLIEK